MRKNFCSAPWSSLAIDPNGSSRVCCVSNDTTDFIGFNNVKNNKKFVEIRENFIQDKQHSNCDNCWIEEKNNAEQWLSRRSMFQYNDFYHNLDDAKDFKLEYLDARWSNHCNLSCVYCSASWSSTWANLQGKKQRTANKVQISEEDVKFLKNILLAGGEPFLIKENVDLLEMMLKVNPEVSIEVTSNLTFGSKNRILDLLKQFPNVTIIASFEAIEEKFEYIRRGADWKTFLKNLEYCSNTFKQLQSNMVYFSLSAYGIVDAINVARQYMPENEIYIRNECNGADFHRVEKNCLEKIKRKINNDISNLPKCLQTQLENLLAQTQSNSVFTNLKDINDFDILTGSNHKELFPELYYQGE